jgi:hypothetical protein
MLHFVIATGLIYLRSSETENVIFIKAKKLLLDLFYFLHEVAEIREKVLSGIFFLTMCSNEVCQRHV